MTFDIPNYDSIVGRAALAVVEPPMPVAPPPVAAKPVIDANGWDPNRIELDMEELAETLRPRVG
jgi:hypothetical protein